MSPTEWISYTTDRFSPLVKRVKETAPLTKDAIFSEGWWYPLLGIQYFISNIFNPSLYRCAVTAVAPVIFEYLLVYFGITFARFIFTYLPHWVVVCAFYFEPLTSVPFTLVLGEGFKAFFLCRVQDEIFEVFFLEGTNKDKSSGSGVEKLKKRFTDRLDRFGTEGIHGEFETLGETATNLRDRFGTFGTEVGILRSWLNALPVVGTVTVTVLFLLHQGINAGPRFHAPYFRMKKFDASRRESFIEKRKGDYTAFGAVALALNLLVPIAGLRVVFGFTSAIGAALWARKLDKAFLSSIKYPH